MMLVQTSFCIDTEILCYIFISRMQLTDNLQYRTDSYYGTLVKSHILSTKQHHYQRPRVIIEFILATAYLSDFYYLVIIQHKTC